MKVYNLVCEDASHLGGPMGSEYTTVLWNKTFISLEKAKAYAEKQVNTRPNWRKSPVRKNSFYWDSGAYIFSINYESVS